MSEALKSLARALREEELDKCKWWVCMAVEDLARELKEKEKSHDK